MVRSKVKNASEEEARRIYDSIVEEKVGKGYKPKGAATSESAQQAAVTTEILERLSAGESVEDILHSQPDCTSLDI